MGDELFELSRSETLRREQVAERLRQIADQLARHNRIEVVEEGRRYTVQVPDEVQFNVEVEIGDESEIEIEISW